MFTVTLGKKVYKIEKVTTRALYELGPAIDMFNKINEVTQASLKGEPVEETGADDIKEALNVMIDWFVVFCGNKFTRDEILDQYPADCIITDITLAIRAVQMHVTEALKAFPTTPRPSKTKGAEEPTQASAGSPCRSTPTAWIRDRFHRLWTKWTSAPTSASRSGS